MLSSFSSFEAQQQITHPEPPGRALNREGSACFSAFEEDNSHHHLFPNASNTQNRFPAYPHDQHHPLPKKRNQINSLCSKIHQLEEVVITLQHENQKIRSVNADLRQELEQCRTCLKAIEKDSQYQRQLLKAEFMKHQAEGSHKKEKIEGLLKEIDKMRTAIKALKEEVNLYKAKASTLEAEVRRSEIRQGKDESEASSEWQCQFLEMFTEMITKMSPEVDEHWSLKKKVQIGWKIIKNMLQKALNQGIRPPRIEKPAQ